MESGAPGTPPGCAPERSRVVPRPNTSPQTVARPRSASDGKGLTRIEHLLPGTYTLTVRAVGYRTAEQQVTVLDADETRVKIVLERVDDK